MNAWKVTVERDGCHLADLEVRAAQLHTALAHAGEWIEDEVTKPAAVGITLHIALRRRNVPKVPHVNPYTGEPRPFHPRARRIDLEPTP
jgi:hypothetical protein